MYNLLSELASTANDEKINDVAAKPQGDNFSTKIIDWNTKGRVFYDFINIDIEVRELVNKRDEKSVGYHIERLRPKVNFIIIH